MTRTVTLAQGGSEGSEGDKRGKNLMAGGIGVENQNRLKDQPSSNFADVEPFEQLYGQPERETVILRRV